MRKLLYSPLAFALLLMVGSFGFYSCDEDEITLATRNIDIPLTYQFALDVPTAGSPSPFTYEEILEITDNAEFDEYEALNDIEIDRIAVKIIDIQNAPDTTIYSLDGQASFPDVQQGIAYDLVIDNLKQASTDGTEYDLDITDENLRTIATSALSTGQVRMVLDGELSHSPITILFEVIINTNTEVELKVG